MKSYEEIIQRTADFDYMMRTRLPEKYMPEVFGVTAGKIPICGNSFTTHRATA